MARAKRATNGAAGAAAPTAEAVEAIAEERDLLKQLAIERHRREKRRALRTGFAAWYAHLVGEIEFVRAQLADQHCDLFLALGWDEAHDLREVLDRAAHELSGRGPRCVPAFLVPDPRIPTGRRS
jgi:hypothetical protein